MENLNLKVELPASPERVYKAWLNSKEHEAFTGGGKASVKAQIGSTHSAWDGYIYGKTLELEPGKRILQSWRTTEFPDKAEDSMIEIKLESKGKGSVLHLKHWNIPDGQGKMYKEGWRDYYFEPMKEYFKRIKD